MMLDASEPGAETIRFERVYAAQLETPEAGMEAGRLIALAEEMPSALLCFERDPALMRPGLSVRVEVVRNVWKDALLVPRTAMRFDAGRAVLRLPAGREADVSLLGCGPLSCAVTGPIQEGDAVAAP